MSLLINGNIYFSCNNIWIFIIKILIVKYYLNLLFLLINILISVNSYSDKMWSSYLRSPPVLPPKLQFKLGCKTNKHKAMEYHYFMLRSREDIYFVPRYSCLYNCFRYIKWTLKFPGCLQSDLPSLESQQIKSAMFNNDGIKFISMHK